jgi:hypothetical protein
MPSSLPPREMKRKKATKEKLKKKNKEQERSTK